MTGTDWSDVRERVAELADGSPADRVFGVVEHRWVLEPPLSPAELAELEGQIGVEPFPHTSAFNPAADLPPQPDEDDFESEEEFNAAEDRWWEEHDRVVHDPAHSVGAIYLCHHGCALRVMLVVSGPARGTMWSDDTADQDGFNPLLSPDGTPLTFADWYRRWLDEPMPW